LKKCRQKKLPAHGKKLLPGALNINQIDLCLLQFTGIIDIDRFPLAEYIENLRPRFAMAVAGTFCSAKGR